jgi:hypothetical protein
LVWWLLPTVLTVLCGLVVGRLAGSFLSILQLKGWFLSKPGETLPPSEVWLGPEPMIWEDFLILHELPAYVYSTGCFPEWKNRDCCHPEGPVYFIRQAFCACCDSVDLVAGSLSVRAYDNSWLFGLI